MQVAHRQRVHFFVREHNRHFINRSYVFGSDNGLFFDVAEQRNLPLDVLGEKAVGAAQQNVRLNSDAQQFLHRVLRGLGLQLLRRRNKRHQRHMHKQRVLAPGLLAHLADRLDKRQRLDVAHRAADLDDENVHILRAFLRRRLDLVGHVRNHLHGLPEVVATALLGDDLLVKTPGRPVVVAGKFGVREALVVPEVEIGLRPIVGDEHLPMLKRRHGSRIDVQIRIELHQVDLEPAAFKQASNRCRRQSLAQ